MIIKIYWENTHTFKGYLKDKLIQSLIKEFKEFGAKFTAGDCLQNWCHLSKGR